MIVCYTWYLGLFQVNGEDLTQASHYRAQQVLGHYFPVCRLTVYREKAEENRPIEKEGKQGNCMQY
jgi:hypothetical protein